MPSASKRELRADGESLEVIAKFETDTHARKGDTEQLAGLAHANARPQLVHIFNVADPVRRLADIPLRDEVLEAPVTPDVDITIW